MKVMDALIRLRDAIDGLATVRGQERAWVATGKRWWDLRDDIEDARNRLHEALIDVILSDGDDDEE